MFVDLRNFKVKVVGWLSMSLFFSNLRTSLGTNSACSCWTWEGCWVWGGIGHHPRYWSRCWRGGRRTQDWGCWSPRWAWGSCGGFSSARVRKNLTEKLEPLPRDELRQTDQCGVRKRKSPTRLGSQFVPKKSKTSSKENMECVSRNLGSVTSQVLDINWIALYRLFWSLSSRRPKHEISYVHIRIFLLWNDAQIICFQIYVWTFRRNRRIFQILYHYVPITHWWAQDVFQTTGHRSMTHTEFGAMICVWEGMYFATARFMQNTAAIRIRNGVKSNWVRSRFGKLNRQWKPNRESSRGLTTHRETRLEQNANEGLKVNLRTQGNANSSC